MEFIKGFLSFLKSAYSEPDGTGSSSRILSSILAGVSSYLLITIVNHVIHLTDVSLLGLWLAAFPYIVGSLVFFFGSPYGTNKGSNLLSDLLTFLKGRKNE